MTEHESLGIESSRQRDFILFRLGRGAYSWRGVGYLLAVFFAALLFAALVAPLIFWGFQVFAARGVGLGEYVVEKGFLRTFDRVRWLPVLFLLPWLFKKCDLLSMERLGLGRRSFSWRMFACWWLFGVAMILPVLLAQYATGSPLMRLPVAPEVVLEVAAKALVGGVVLGFLEELVFRGLTLRMFYTAVRPWVAVVLGSLFFAAVHFKKVPKEIFPHDTGGIAYLDGLAVAYWTVFSFLATFEWVKFANLFLVGAALSMLALRSRSLWPCVALHAGWIFVLGVQKDFVKMPSTGPVVWVGSERVLDGLLCSVVLLALCVWIGWRYGEPAPDPAAEPEGAEDTRLLT